MDGLRIPGVMLDDVYRLLGDRRPEDVALEVESVEPESGTVRIRYRLIDAAGEPVRDAAGELVGIVGLIDGASGELRPGTRLRIPGRDEVGTAI